LSNRFVPKIKSGEIASIEELKSEFKGLAKLTHPDLRAPGDRPGAEADFVSVRAEYEAALRGFEKHRFGARSTSRAPRAAYAGGLDAAHRGVPLGDAAWACLALLLKRGFPKSPRHEKERLRYEYARWRLAEALGPEEGQAFAEFESDLLDMKAAGAPSLEPAMALVRELLDYRARGLAAMRTQIVLALGAIRADPGVGTGFRRFVDALAAELGIGGEIGGVDGR
jgi:hypothetical protein